MRPYQPSCRGRTSRQPGYFPFGKAVFKPTRLITPLTERRDGLERQDAPRAPAIRNNLSIRRKLRQPSFQLRQRYVQRAGQMALPKFILGPDIEHRHRPGSQAVQQLDAGDRLQLVTGAEVGCHDAGDFGAVPLADPAQRIQQTDDGIFTREPIEYPLALPAALDQPGAAKQLQVAGTVGERDPGAGREVFDAALTLREVLEQFEPMDVAERLRNLCEAGKDALFGTEA